MAKWHLFLAKEFFCILKDERGRWRVTNRHDKLCTFAQEIPQSLLRGRILVSLSNEISFMQTSEMGTLKEQGYWQRTCLWLVNTCIWNRLLTIRQWPVIGDANMHAKTNPGARQSAYCSLRNRVSRSGIWDKHWFAFSIRLYIKYCT